MKAKYIIQAVVPPGESPLQFSAVAHRNCIPGIYGSNSDPATISGYFVNGIEPEDPEWVAAQPCHFCGKE